MFANGLGIVARDEPDQLSFVALSIVLASAGRVATVIAIVQDLRSHQARLRTLAIVLPLTTIAMAALESKSRDVHWSRSASAFERAAILGRLPCSEAHCELGNWTATEVRTTDRATVVFVLHEWCYAGAGFAKPTSPDVSTDDIGELLGEFGYVDVHASWDGWYEFCITT